MLTFAFWNLNNKVNSAQITTFAREQDVDVLVLAEDQNELSDLVLTLNHGAERLYFPDRGLSHRLTILTRFRTTRDSLIRDSDGIAIRHYSFPLGESILVVAVHLSSKLWKSNEAQILASTRIARYIREAEERLGHSRTIVIGDLNMNPFEIGVVGSEGFHAVMDRRIAATGSRKVQGESSQFFYNPMWSTFGDLDSTPPGTYFYNAGSEVNYYWNVFDQVLFRPDLLNYLPEDSTQVVTSLGGQSLLTDAGRPDSENLSDHLPVVCKLNEILETVNDE